MSTDTVKCPKCSSDMVLRTARQGKNAGNKFYGCSDFPKCKGTLNYSEDDSSRSTLEEPSLSKKEQTKICSDVQCPECGKKFKWEFIEKEIFNDSKPDDEGLWQARMNSNEDDEESLDDLPF